ncbi:MAG TPA: class I SAM-dependent methyltransferase [Kofleriaceae bacterium]
MDGDRERWNAKWRERAGELEAQAPLLTEFAPLLPTRGKAIDVAGGAGRNAIWLARRGLEVTVVDISDVALDKGERRAATAGLASRMKFVRHDLDRELPFAPLFDLVLIFHYLNRARRDDYAGLLHEGGILVAAQPTVENLTRHAKPSREYCVEAGELERWVRELGMDVLTAREGWNTENRHEAAVIAKRRSRVVKEIPREDSGPSQGPYR